MTDNSLPIDQTALIAHLLDYGRQQQGQQAQSVARGVANMPGLMLGGMLDVPRQAFNESENLRNTGEFNAGPVLGAASMAMTGGMPFARGAAVSPIRKPQLPALIDASPKASAPPTAVVPPGGGAASVDFMGLKLGPEWSRMGETGVAGMFPTRAMLERDLGVAPEVADALAEFAQWHGGKTIEQAIAELRQTAKDAPWFAETHNGRANILERLSQGDPTLAPPPRGVE